MKHKLYFISSNLDKIGETKTILDPLITSSDYEVEGYDPRDLMEIQSKSLEEIVRDKAMKAYKELQRPLIVEHTGLEIKDFGNLPGGLTQVFWSSFAPSSSSGDKTVANMITCSNFCKHFGGKRTTAISWVAFCDGKQIKTYDARIEGIITMTPRGSSAFQWDPVFQPSGYNQTFAEMTEEAEENKTVNKKNEISMRRKALEKFAQEFVKMYKDTAAALAVPKDDHILQIKKAIKEKNLILFIGAGVSGPLNLPTWGKLIDKVAAELGYEPDVFKLYGDYPILAEFYKIRRETDTSLLSLKEWMKKKLILSEDKVKSSEVHQEIVKLGCSIVYTTNYEHALELAFNPAYKKIASIKDMASIPADTVQIVKFHGDMDDEDSIVFAEQDYFKRLNFESPLDIKLRADMLGKSILFLGYSMSDINIRLLIYKLNQLWRDAIDDDADCPKSYIFMAQPNPIQEKIFNARGIIPIVGECADRSASLLQFLRTLND